MSILVALYPRVWRRRYGAELEAILEEGPLSLAIVLDVLLGAIDARAHPQIADEGDAPRITHSAIGLLSRVMFAVGVFMPVAMLLASHLFGVLRYEAPAPFITTAFVTGVFVGRWWAPAPCVGVMVLVTALDPRPIARAAIQPIHHAAVAAAHQRGSRTRIDTANVTAADVALASSTGLTSGSQQLDWGLAHVVIALPIGLCWGVMTSPAIRSMVDRSATSTELAAATR